jgi:outer membrane protein assembly factor BamB
MVHLMNPQVGTDQIPPVKFLPPNAKVVGSILVDTRLYAATSGKCGGAANGVWAVDLVGADKAVSSFDTKGAGVAGAVAPTFGTDGTVYVATLSGDSPVANAVVALDARTLEQRDSFSAASPFTSAPVVFQYKGRDLIVAANKDGRLYLLDSASLGGADHKTPLHKTSAFTAGAPDVTGLASWADAGGTRWVIATTGALAPDAKFTMAGGAAGAGAVVAFTVGDSGDAPVLQPQWASAEIKGPLTPAVINGVVFALASGDGAAAPARGSRGGPAILYALDGATGKQLWTSGNTITSAVRSVGPSGGDSQVYVAAEDGTLYAFGMPAER